MASQESGGSPEPEGGDEAAGGDVGGETQLQDGGQNEQEEGPLFSCRLDNAKAITTVLTCLSHGSRRAQHAQCEATPEGLTFVVTGKAKFTQAQGCLGKDLFQAYECDEEGGRFGINLSMLLECLQIFGVNSAAAASMVYSPATATFKVTLEEGGVFTSCEMRTLMEGGDSMEFAELAAAFRSSPEECRCIFRSEALKEAFQELADLPGAASVVIEVSQKAPHFKMATSGNYGSSAIHFPRNSEAFVHFSCKVPNLRWTYALPALEGGMRGLPFAQETYLRINGDGIMCIQHQVQVSGHNTFVDFIICANVNDMDDEGGMLSAPLPNAPDGMPAHDSGGESGCGSPAGDEDDGI